MKQKNTFFNFSMLTTGWEGKIKTPLGGCPRIEPRTGPVPIWKEGFKRQFSAAWMRSEISDGPRGTAQTDDRKMGVGSWGDGGESFPSAFPTTLEATWHKAEAGGSNSFPSASAISYGSKAEFAARTRGGFLSCVPGLISISPVPRDPFSTRIIMAANPYPVVIWRGAVVDRRRRRSIVVRSAVGAEGCGCYGCCGSNCSPCHSERKQKRVTEVALVGIGARRRKNHKKSQTDGCHDYDLFHVHCMPPDVRSMMLLNSFSTEKT